MVAACWRIRIASIACLVSVFIVAGIDDARADDYVRDTTPSSAAKAHFAAVRKDLPLKKIAKGTSREDPGEESYYTEDGSISIPPRSMVVFKMAGKCMDPHLPAPAAGEPMQFVDADRLIPARLRPMYDNLIARQSQGDVKVLSNNPQHLVWAIRTAGTDDPFANNLSEAQLEILDECAGRRGAFMKYHEKEKRRNARRKRRQGDASGGGRISVGGFSYDAADLTGTNAARRIESHISALTEMGETSKIRTEDDFRYGEIEEELYSDISCDGGLSFTARILNASGHRKEFRAADFVAQVGNGGVKGSMRQRITIGIPDEISIVAGALREGVEIDYDASIATIEGESTQHIRGRSYRKRTSKSGRRTVRTEQEREKKQKTTTEIYTTVEEVELVPPVPPVPPVPITNEVPENVSVRVVSLDYDEVSSRGTLVVEIERGSFKMANNYIRKNFARLVRKKPSVKSSARMPEDANMEITSVSISENGFCEIEFTAKKSED